MHNWQKLLVMGLITVPLLAACGSNEKVATKPKPVTNGLNKSQAVVGKTTLTANQRKTIAPMLNEVYNQTGVAVDNDTTKPLTNVFNKSAQGVYFPSALQKTALQTHQQNVKVKIPNQTKPVIYTIADHYIAEIFKNQVVMRPVHTVQGITGLTKQNQKLDAYDAVLMNHKYGALIAKRVKKALATDSIQAIRYVPIKVVHIKKLASMTQKTMLVNQQFKLANGNYEAQTIKMNFYYSLGQPVTTQIKAGGKISPVKTPKSQWSSGSLIGFATDLGGHNVNLLNQKLDQKALTLLSQNSLNSLN